MDPHPQHNRPADWRSIAIRPQTLALLLAAPALVLLVVVYAYPVARLFWLSVSLPELGLDNYARFFGASVYLRILGNTLKVAAMVTVACLVLGYPTAYLLASVSRGVRTLLLVFVLLPFWTSLLVRTFAWIAMLQKSGPVNQFLVKTGLVDEPVQLVYNTLGVTIGMTHVLLPFMVLSLLSVMTGIDRRLVLASRTLGAGPVAAFRHVYLPLSAPGVAAGCLLVFITALGFFITPALLGGARDIMVSQLIETEVQTSLNWGFASAIAVVLLVVTVAMYAVYQRLIGLGRGMRGTTAGG